MRREQRWPGYHMRRVFKHLGRLQPRRMLTVHQPLAEQLRECKPRNRPKRK